MYFSAAKNGLGMTGAKGARVRNFGRGKNPNRGAARLEGIAGVDRGEPLWQGPVELHFLLDKKEVQLGETQGEPRVIAIGKS